MNSQVFYSKERLAQIEAGYFELLKLRILDAVFGRQNVYNGLLDDFKEALINANFKKIEDILQTIKNSISTTSIISPINHSTITSKIIDIEGITEKLCNIILINKTTANTNKSFKVLSNKNGNFKFMGIELAFGVNDFWLYNERFLFVDNQKLHLQITVTEKYLFLGLYDPLTQKMFEVNEIEHIVRCVECKNFMYNFSVEENKGQCVVKGCNGKHFLNSADTGFWTR